MSTVQILAIDSTSGSSTEQLAERLGRNLRGREVIELLSDLGGGKTTFVRGLARGIGSTDLVSSPTFTLNNEYHGPKLRLMHYDFYRLGEAGIMAEELAEALEDVQTVIVVEWAGIVENVLPPERLKITIDVTGEDSRRVSFDCPPALKYLMKELQ